MATHDTILTDHSLSRRSDALAIAVTLPWYRSLWLSSVSDLAVSLDGRPVAREALRVELGARSWRVEELPDQWDVLWFIQDKLVVLVPAAELGDAGPTDHAHDHAADHAYDVEVMIDLRLPYMQIAPQRYVGNHVTNRRQLVAS